MSLTPDQIRRRLVALVDYEMTVHRNANWPGETPEAVDRELERISVSRQKLKAMLETA